MVESEMNCGHFSTTFSQIPLGNGDHDDLKFFLTLRTGSTLNNSLCLECFNRRVQEEEEGILMDIFYSGKPKCHFPKSTSLMCGHLAPSCHHPLLALAKNSLEQQFFPDAKKRIKSHDDATDNFSAFLIHKILEKVFVRTKMIRVL